MWSGQPVADVYALFFEAAAQTWASIPFQVDERVWLDLATCLDDSGYGNVDAQLSCAFDGVFLSHIAFTDEPGDEPLIVQTTWPLPAGSGNVGASLAEQIEAPPFVEARVQYAPEPGGALLLAPGAGLLKLLQRVRQRDRVASPRKTDSPGVSDRETGGGPASIRELRSRAHTRSMPVPSEEETRALVRWRLHGET